MTIQILPSKPNAAARFGQAYGKYLSENIPKEAERRGLSEDLRNISEQKDLTPFQQFAGLASARGATPQIVESGSKLLQHQSKMDAYNKRTNKGEAPAPEQAGFDQRMEGYNQRLEQKPVEGKARKERALEAEPTQTGAATESPLDKKYLPAPPFTQSMRENAIDEAFTSGLANNFDEASAIADDAERRYMQAPEQYKKDLAHRVAVDKQVDDLYDAELSTRLQKQGPETFADLSGDEQLNIKKKARNDVATGRMTPQQAAEHYSKKSLDIAKDKSRIKEIGNRGLIDSFLPHKKEDNLKSLVNISKNFRDMNMQEDYYNLLGAGKKAGGLSLSPGARAVIAYERSEPVKKLMKDAKIENKKDFVTDTIKFTDDLAKSMGPDDSILAVAKLMKENHPRFNQDAYFDYLRNNQDRLGLNPRLKREINRGALDWAADWEDMQLFPYFKRMGTNE